MTGKSGHPTPTWQPPPDDEQLSRRLDAAELRELPTSAFAFPRQRNEPLGSASRVRNALSRFDQVTEASDADRALAFRKYPARRVVLPPRHDGEIVARPHALTRCFRLRHASGPGRRAMRPGVDTRERMVMPCRGVRARRVYEQAAQSDGKRVLGGPALASRPVQGQGPPGRVAQGRGAVGRAAPLVRPPACQVRRVQARLRGRAERARTGRGTAAHAYFLNAARGQLLYAAYHLIARDRAMTANCYTEIPAWYQSKPETVSVTPGPTGSRHWTPGGGALFRAKNAMAECAPCLRESARARS
jgi:hypothetical protein